MMERARWNADKKSGGGEKKGGIFPPLPFCFSAECGRKEKKKPDSILFCIIPREEGKAREREGGGASCGLSF